MKGQEKPEIQGWYSEKYNEFEANTTSVFETYIEGNSTFVWILYPSEKPELPIKARIVSRNSDEINLEISTFKMVISRVTVPLHL